MRKKVKPSFRDVENVTLFSAEETLKTEKGNLWSGAAKATKENTRKEKSFTKVDEYQVKDNKGREVTFGTYVPNIF